MAFEERKKKERKKKKKHVFTSICVYETFKIYSIIRNRVVRICGQQSKATQTQRETQPIFYMFPTLN